MTDEVHTIIIQELRYLRSEVGQLREAVAGLKVRTSILATLAGAIAAVLVSVAEFWRK